MPAREDSLRQLDPPSLGLLEQTQFRDDGLATLGQPSLDAADVEQVRASALQAQPREVKGVSYLQSGRKLSALQQRKTADTHAHSVTKHAYASTSAGFSRLSNATRWLSDANCSRTE